jgi:hypothetical protein
MNNLDSFRDASIRIANSSSPPKPGREVQERVYGPVYKWMDDLFFFSNDLWFRCQVCGLAEEITYKRKPKLTYIW